MARNGKRKPLTHPLTSEVIYTDDEVEFMRAVQAYREENGRPFPGLRELLYVLKQLGYRKVTATQKEENTTC